MLFMRSADYAVITVAVETPEHSIVAFNHKDIEKQICMKMRYVNKHNK